MGELFYWILNMSITAAIVGLAVSACRKIRKIPKRLLTVLWLAPFLRMIFPFTINSPFSILNLVARFTRKVLIMPDLTDLAEFTLSNYMRVADSYFPILFRRDSYRVLFALSGWIWLSVALFLQTVWILAYRRTMKDLQDPENRKSGVLIVFSKRIKEPAVYGIWNPLIYLPMEYEKEINPYILAHEKMHIARHDNLKRILVVGIVCFHWFNPLAWRFLRYYLEDLEFACDEAVIAHYSQQQKKEYALTLIDRADHRKKAFFASAFGSSNLRMRLEHVLSYKKMSIYSSLCFTAFILLLLFTMLTNAD